MAPVSNARELLRATVNRYKLLDSYADSGNVTTLSVATAAVQRVTFSTLYQRPSQFRFSFSRPHPYVALAHSITHSVVGHSGTLGYHTIKSPDGTIERRSPIGLAEAIARATGVSNGAVHTLGKLLFLNVPGRSLLDLQDLRQTTDAFIDDKLCHVLAAGAIGGRQTEIWIEKDSYLLRKVINRSQDHQSEELRENINIDAALRAEQFDE